MKIILIFCFFISPAFLSAQDVLFSKVINGKWQNSILLNNSSDSSCLVSYKNNYAKLLLVNDSLILLSEKKIKATYKNNMMRIVSVISIDNRNIIFAAFWNYEHKMDYLFGRYIDSKGDYIGEWKKISEHTQLVAPNSTSFFIKKSLNNKFIAIYSHDYKEYSRGPIDIHINIIDANFHELNTISTVVGSIKTQVFVEQMELGNNGHLFLKLVENKGVYRERGNYVYKKDFTILDIAVDDSLFSVNKLILSPDVFITDAVIKVRKDNSLIVGGYYSNYGFVSSAGSFYCNVNNGKLNHITRQPFSKAFVNRYKFPQVFERRIDDEILKFSAQRLEYNENGDVFLIGEQIYKYSVDNGAIGRGSIYDIDDLDTYYYGDIFIKKINGKNNWEQLIPKKQKGNNSSFISFSYLFNDSNFVFVFNIFPSDSRNYNAIYKSFSNGRTKLVKLDFAGNIIGESVFDVTTLCNPLVYKPFVFNDYILLMTKKNRLVRFNY